jgi:small-conductance mechanosensitive channel
VERPIKAGDWVELPSGMGYVRNINVRSTEIETFDRSSLFVPNSQLISENVINWTHGNLHGRIIVKVGVSYDSDPRQVERILLEIARGHPLMLRRPAPYVLFRGFGADALEFEIRGILRDVNWILNVQSDINFEIARRFSEAGVQVPFKQADIKLKNPDEIATALAALNAGRAAGPDAETPETAPRAAGPAPRPPLSADEPARDPDADGAGGGDR